MLFMKVNLFQLFLFSGDGQGEKEEENITKKCH